MPSVKLPRSQPVEFPPRCIICQSGEPGHATRVRRTTSSWWAWLFPFLHLVSLIDGHSVHVPACPGCGWKLHAQAWWRWLAIVLILVVYVWLAADVVALWLPRPLAKWAVLGGGMIVLLPYTIWHISFPLPFDMTVSTDEVEYEFKEESTARDFYVLNSIKDA